MHILLNIKNYFSFNSYAKQLKNDSNSYPYEISLKYKIINTKRFSPEKSKEQIIKIQNLINNVVIKPKQVFSFWKIIGNPSAISNENIPLLDIELFTSIIYYLSLLGGLSIIERHHYLFDNFDDVQRFFPLGADAEILYRCKDLKIKNNFSFPVKLKLEITSHYICGYIMSTQELKSNEVIFKCRNFKNYKEVLTLINRRTVEVSVYKKV